MLRNPVVKLPEKSPPHFTNLKPLFGVTVTVTCVPSAKKPSGVAGLYVNAAEAAGFTVAVSAHDE